MSVTHCDARNWAILLLAGMLWWSLYHHERAVARWRAERRQR